MKCSLSFLGLWIALTPAVNAAVHLYDYTATVTEDAGTPLVEPGDIIHGTFAYDADPTSAIRFPSNPIPFTWDRPTPPIGITVDANGTLLAQNPDNFAQMWILNGTIGAGGDQLEFHSYIGPRTAEDPFLYSGPALFLVLYDPTGTVFDSSDLPTKPLSLSAFTSAELTVYDGVNPYFKASITDLVQVPEPNVYGIFATVMLMMIPRPLSWLRTSSIVRRRVIAP